MYSLKFMWSSLFAVWEKYYGIKVVDSEKKISGIKILPAKEIVMDICRLLYILLHLISLGLCKNLLLD